WLVGSSFRGRAVWGREISLPLEQLSTLEFRNGRLTYLSDVEPSDYHHTPYLSVTYPTNLIVASSAMRFRCVDGPSASASACTPAPSSATFWIATIVALRRS